MLLHLAVSLPLLSAVFSAAVPSGLPSFCHDLDCPQFDVIQTTKDYQLRHYNETKWASVQKEGATRETVNQDMFMTLFHYITGENERHIKIDMTAPVLTTVTHGQGPNCASNFTMHFMIPHSQWSAPIAPTNPDVNIVTLPAMDVYVKDFGGFAHDEDFTENVMTLYNVLQSQNIDVDTTSFYDAGYDGPYQFAHRHNEVWIRKL